MGEPVERKLELAPPRLGISSQGAPSPRSLSRIKPLVSRNTRRASWSGSLVASPSSWPRRYMLFLFESLFFTCPVLSSPHTTGKWTLTAVHVMWHVGVYEGSTIIILKWGSTGEVSNSFLIPSQGVPYSRSKPIWGTRSRGELKLSPACR